MTQSPDNGAERQQAVCPAQRLNQPTVRHTITTGQTEGHYVWSKCSCGEQWWQPTRELVR